MLSTESKSPTSIAGASDRYTDARLTLLQIATDIGELLSGANSIERGYSFFVATCHAHTMLSNCRRICFLSILIKLLIRCSNKAWFSHASRSYVFSSRLYALVFICIGPLSDRQAADMLIMLRETHVIYEIVIVISVTVPDGRVQ